MERPTVCLITRQTNSHRQPDRQTNSHRQTDRSLGKMYIDRSDGLSALSHNNIIFYVNPTKCMSEAVPMRKYIRRSARMFVSGCFSVLFNHGGLRQSQEELHVVASAEGAKPLLTRGLRERRKVPQRGLGGAPVANANLACFGNIFK